MVFVPAIAGLGEVAFFVVCIIVIYALTFLIMALTGVLRYVPVVGGWMQDNLVSHVGDALSSAAGWAVSGLGKGLGLIWTPITWIAALFGRIGELGWEAVNATDRIVHGAIPRAIDTSRAYADQRYWDAVGHADQLYAQETAYAQQLEHQAEAHADVLAQQETAYAQSLYAAGISYTQQETHAAEAFTQQLANQGIAYTQAETAAAEAFTQQLANQGEAYTQQAIASTQGWVQQQVGALEHEIAAGYTAATTYAHDVAAAAVLPVAALAGATSLSLTKYLEECGTNLCRGLNPLSTLLQELGAVVEGGLLFALVAQAVRDPGGTAHEVRSLVTPVVDEASAGFRALTGVHG